MNSSMKTQKNSKFIIVKQVSLDRAQKSPSSARWCSSLSTTDEIRQVKSMSA